jgi:hypothetical protein
MHLRHRPVRASAACFPNNAGGAQVMKSEHRHELQTNELGKFAEKMAVFIDIHGNRIMMGVCLACLPLAGFIYWWRSDSNAQAAAWRDFSAAINSSKVEEFHAVWQDHPGTAPAYWARVHEGEHWLAQGVEAMFRSVETGAENLKKARDSFQAVIDDRARAPAELRDRALIGLGRAYESISDGSEGEAIKAYETLINEFPNSIYKKDAEERIRILNRGSGQEFYAWFTKYARPKVPVKAPRDRLSDGQIDEKTKEMLEQFESMKKDTDPTEGEKSTDADETLTLPESQAPESASPPETEPKPDSVPEPESNPDNE